MSVRVAINGFGRIGRTLMRCAREGVDVVGINDLLEVDHLAHLLQYDSVHGRYPGTVQARDGKLVVDGVEIAVSAERDPALLPWKALGVDVALECTGKFRDRAACDKHLQAGARRVIVSAPAKQHDVTLAFGINHTVFDPAKHFILSGASCTTHCLAGICKVLDEAFGIVRAHMTTIHAYTSDQSLVDGPHKDLRRARAAALSMIPTTTGAARAVAEVLPRLAGRFEGVSIRVPTPAVSLVDLVAELDRRASAAEINAALRAAAEGPLANVLAVTEEPLVSADFRGDRHSAIVDLASTSVLEGKLAKVLAWYDNEFGYSQRLIELARWVGGRA